MKPLSFIIILVLSFFTSLELVPLIITVLIPSFCYGCTDLGKFHQELNNKFGLSYFNFIAMLLLFLYLIYLTVVSKYGLALKLFIITICFLCIYLPVFPIINPLNLLMCALCDNPPFINDRYATFPASKNIEAGASKIIAEYHKFSKNNEAVCITEVAPGFRVENRTPEAELANNCWRTLYLKRAGVISADVAKDFPETQRLLDDPQIHHAFFSILDPGVDIPPHVGYYKGYLRYHLGVEIPNNSDIDDSRKAFIVCGGEKYVWRLGSGVLFDDFYLHYVKNPSGERRVVLYIDVIRNSDNIFINAANNFGLWLIETSPTFKVFLTNQHKQNKLKDE